MCKNQKYTSPVNGYTHLDLPYIEMLLFVYTLIRLSMYYPTIPPLGIYGDFKQLNQLTHRRANLLCQIPTYPHRDMTSYVQGKVFVCLMNHYQN